MMMPPPPPAGPDGRALRRLVDAQAKEISDLRARLAAADSLQDDEGWQQLQDADELHASLVELRNVIWPEVMQLRERNAQHVQEIEALRDELERTRAANSDALSELEALRGQAEAAASARAHAEHELATSNGEVAELRARCNALVLDINKATERALRAESRLAQAEARQAAAEDVRAQLDTVRAAEGKQRARADTLARELTQARMSLSSTLEKERDRLHRPDRTHERVRADSTPTARPPPVELRTHASPRSGRALTSAAEAARRLVDAAESPPRRRSGAHTPRSRGLDTRARAAPGSSDEADGSSDGAMQAASSRPRRKSANARMAKRGDSGVGDGPSLRQPASDSDDSGGDHDGKGTMAPSVGTRADAELQAQLKRLHESFRATVQSTAPRGHGPRH